MRKSDRGGSRDSTTHPSEDIRMNHLWSHVKLWIATYACAAISAADIVTQTILPISRHVRMQVKEKRMLIIALRKDYKDERSVPL